MKTIDLLMLVCLICVASESSAQKPVLGLPIGHNEEIIHLSFSQDGKYVLTADRNSLKLWDFGTGKLLRSNDEHGVFDFARLSPDAAKVFFVSFVSYEPVDLCWDIEKGTVYNYSPEDAEDMASALQKIFLQSRSSAKWEFNAVYHAFSPDGKQAVLVNKKSDFQLWNIMRNEMLGKGTSPTPLFAEEEFEPFVGIRQEKVLAVLREGQNTLQVWDLIKGNLLQSMTDKSMFYKMAVLSPDGKSIIATDRNRIQHWDRETGRLVRTWQTDVVSFAPVAPHKIEGLTGASPRGFFNFLGSLGLAGVSPRTIPGGLFVGMKTGIRRWDFETGSIADAWIGSTRLDENNMPYHIQSGPSAHLKVWQDGKIQQKNLPALSRAIPEYFNITVAQDLKKAIFFRHPYADSLWVWDLEKDRQVSLLTGKEIGFITPDLRYAVLKVDGNAELWNLETGRKLYAFPKSILMEGEGWESYVVSADGKYMLYCRPIKFEDDGFGNFHLFDLENGQLLSEFSLEGAEVYKGKGMPVIALSPDNKHVLFGIKEQEEPVQLLDVRTGRVVRRFEGQKGGTESLAFSSDGRAVFTAGGDCSLRIWDVETGKEIASLFALGERDWVVTSPDGLFDASPGAMSLMYYTVGREVVELEQLKKRYWEPGLLTQIMQNKPLRDVSAFSTLPLYPEIEAGISGNQLHVKLTKRSGGIGKLSLFVNGNEVVGDVNPDKKNTLDIDLSQFNKFYLDTNTLALRVFIAEGWLKSQAYELRYIPVASKGQDNNPSGGKTSFSPGLPHLYAIVVGTSEYANATMRLRFPDLDAEVFAQALQASGARLFPDRVHLQLLSTAAGQTLANKNNIRAAFETLEGQAKAGDILVVYFSGHGITYGPAENSQFYYLTKDVAGPDLSIPEDRKSFTVSSEELTGWLKEIPALKRVLIFDACNAGSLAKAFEAGAKEFSPSQVRAYDEMKDRTGTFILAGAAADKVSFEANEYGQGLLTYSLLEGMNGLALLDDKRVDVMKLFQHARTTVPKLAKDINKVQTPMMAFPKGSDGGSGASFSIGKVDSQVKMPPLKAVKPVYIKSVFLEEEAKEDLLELGQALADYFDELTTMAANPPLIYVPVDKYENGYKISGTYLITGESVQINGILKKGAVKKGSFEVKGAKNNIRDLVLEVVDKVQGMVDRE